MKTKLPYDLVLEIIKYLPDETIFKLGNEGLIKRVFDKEKHTFWYATMVIHNIKLVKFLYKNNIYIKSVNNKEDFRDTSLKVKKKYNFISNKTGLELRPLRISASLAEFLEEPLDYLVSRPNIVSAINKYITDNNLRDHENKMIFNKNDPKLRKLFGEPIYLNYSSKPERGFGYSLHNINLYLRDQNCSLLW